MFRIRTMIPPTKLILTWACPRSTTFKTSQSKTLWSFGSAQLTPSTCDKTYETSSTRNTSTRPFSKVSDSRSTEHYLEDAFGDESPLEDLRKILYPNCKDPGVNAIINASSVKDLFDCFTKLSQPSTLHTTQALATLFHFRKICCFLLTTTWTERSAVASEFNATLHVKWKPQFDYLIETLEKQVPEIQVNHLAFVLLCLKRFELPPTSKIVQDIHLRISDNIANMDLIGLSYFCR